MQSLSSISLSHKVIELLFSVDVDYFKLVPVENRKEDLICNEIFKELVILLLRFLLFVLEVNVSNVSYIRER